MGVRNSPATSGQGCHHAAGGLLLGMALQDEVIPFVD